MYSRRHVLQCILAAAASPVPGSTITSGSRPALVPDPNRLIDLPRGFSYRIVSRVGDSMDDGLVVPGKHDGMAAFSGQDGRVVLVCNHELKASDEHSAFANGIDALSDEQLARFYDPGRGISPAPGGTTTTVYNPRTGETEHQHLSLAGTEVNCAGGKTPWGTWLSCEECFTSPGTSSWPPRSPREKKHGYVFEVDASARTLAEARPIRAMGRFEHEAAVVHPASGAVFMTEDRHHSLFYRYLPATPGRLEDGGRLQALVVRGRPALATHNWSATRAVRIGESLIVDWIDLDDIEPDENDLRLRGAARGAATFARGEGMCLAGDALAFSCTIGGRSRLGQIFVYQPSPNEGKHNERENPARLTLLTEAAEDTLLHHADNLTMAPWGDLIVCEDTDGPCSLVGIRPDGRQYRLLESAYSDSELAGVCFAPDGKTLFVNIQYPGTTVAITGPWQTLS